MYYILTTYNISILHSLSDFSYAFDCTFFRITCLTVKALRGIAGFCSSVLASCVALPPASMQSCKTSILYVLYITMRGLHAALPCATPRWGCLSPCKSAVLPICLVGTNDPKKCTLNMPFFINNSRCKRVQLRFLG